MGNRREKRREGEREGGNEGGREVRKGTVESSDTCSDKHNLPRPFYLWAEVREDSRNTWTHPIKSNANDFTTA